MLELKSRRGRPKGTGIDDSDRIARLAELIKTRPELRPTTAIKAMGITDPSVIRRLRDKYKAFMRTTVAAGPVIISAPVPTAGPGIPATAATISRH